MSDRFTLRGRGLGGRQVSRQLTDTERALDSDIDAHLSTPRTSEPTAYDIGTNYAWMEEDLKKRAAITGILSQERELAAASGAFQDMDRRFTQETEDEADAIAAMREIDSFLKANRRATYGEAISAATAERPDRWGNKFFNESIEMGMKFHETDLERQKREGDLVVSIASNEINNLTGMAKLDALRSPEGKEYLKRYNEFIMKKELSGAPLFEHEVQLKEEQLKNDLREQKIRSQVLDFSDQTAQGKSRAAYFLMESGLPVKDLDKLGGVFQSNPSLIDAVSHPSFLRRDAKANQALTAALEVLQDPNAKEADIAGAKTALYYVAGAHSKFTAETDLALKMEDRALKYGEERGKSLGQLRDDIDGVLSAQLPKDKRKAPTIPPSEQALNMAEMWIKEQVAADPRLEQTATTYLEKITKARSEKDDAQKGKMAQWIAGDFGMDAAKLSQVSSTKEVTPKPGSGSSGPAPSGLKVGDERKGFIYKGGDPSKPESWTKKP